MLLSNLRGETQSISTYQFILAISVGLEGSYTTSKNITEVSTMNISDFVANEKITDPATNGLKAVIKYFMEFNMLPLNLKGNRSKKVNLNDSLRSEGLPARSFESHYKACMRILQNYSYEDLSYLFLFTTYATRDIHKIIKKNIFRIYGHGHATTTVVDAIYKDFCKFFYDNSRDKLVYQDNASTNLIGFYKTTLDFFEKTGQVYSVYVNETDIDSTIQGGDYSTSALDVYAVEKKKPTVEINFQDITNKIAAASCLLYAHSNQQAALYDIYTKYNSQRVSEIVSNLKSSCKSLLPYIKIENNWDDIEVTQSHVKNKKNNRDNTAEALFVLAERPVRIEELNRLYNAARRADDNDAFNKTQGPKMAKDGLYIFSTIGHKVKSKQKNSEKFQILVDGFNALREFRQYLADRDIDPLSVPADIFRDINLPRRYTSLRSYFDLHPVTSSLIQVERARDLQVKGAIRNDDLYDTLVIGCFDKNNKLIEFLRKGSNLSDIKVAVEQYGKGLEKNEYVSSKAFNAFAATKSIVKPVTILAKEHWDLTTNEISIVAQLLENPSAEDLNRARKLVQKTKLYFKVIQDNLSKFPAEKLQEQKDPDGFYYAERFHLFDIHFTEENIATWFTDNPPALNTPEQRLFVAQNYVGCEDAGPLIVLGGILENDIQFNLRRLKAVESVINSASFKNADKEVQQKLIFFYTNVLEVIMRAEKHPVTEGNYYALTASTLEEEFSYSSSEDARKARCDAIRNAFSVLCGDEYHNEFEMLNLLFISSRMLQYYYFTNRRIIGKSRNLYNGVAPNIINSKKLDQKAVDDFLQDGDFAVLIRAGVFISYLDKAKKSGNFNDLPLENFIKSYFLPNDTDYDIEGAIHRMKLLLLRLSNQFIDEHQDIYDFLGFLARAVHKSFDSSCRDYAIVETPEIINLLDEAVLQARAFVQQNTNEATRQFMLKITANAICDANGYIMDYGKLFKNQSGEYLHSSGVWVQIDPTAEQKISYRLFNDYKHFEGVLNFIYD